ncbi:Glycosyltransferase involved in cell wall bisynthesis [Tranquillimonas rosea]|uniref:Glycosyltransferase involved in cell wall bisynthesis n=1 Tax=Tranquillimonas rosea TaxID=641238 RepID=A0A1H9WTD1_9RHOB|nr:glycosyltransferase [Tranquillimonas rosea]SES37029.1 Glycosyltransferase involved in cell wall bisynthesis [Tranquillimonas rosea]
MKIVFGSAHPYLPQMKGGAQASTHEMALSMTRRGHDVSVLAGLAGEGLIGLRGRIAMKLTGRRTVADTALGYRVHRGWFPWEGVPELVAREAPDVAVVQSYKPVPIARAFLDAGIPSVIYFRNVEVEDLGGDLATLGQIPAIANSSFTAAWFERHYGLKSRVVHPMFTPESYRTETSREYVTFINPHPQKGLETALTLAERCPDIPFLFVEGWGLTGEERAARDARLARLSNVTMHPGTNDMREIYGQTRILLAPSRWEEAFGRVAAEAHYSGIPVIGARRGGLPEAIGPGGLLVDADAPAEEWVAALRALWDDTDRYESVSQAALDYSRRPDLDRESQIDTVLEVLAEAARAGLPARPSAPVAATS